MLRGSHRLIYLFVIFSSIGGDCQMDISTSFDIGVIMINRPCTGLSKKVD